MRSKRKARGEWRVVSLFCGAGGLDIGFKEAGFEIVYAIDNNKDACSTYKHNLGAHVRNMDITQLNASTLPEYDVLIGGPPCQGFSVAGKMDADDPRSKLVWDFVRLIEETTPKAFVLENVAALAKLSRWEDIRSSITEEFYRLHYNVKMLVLNACDYGVPQSRERVFFIGTSKGFSTVTTVPATSPLVTVREALKHLPDPGIPPNHGVCAAKVVPAKQPILRSSPYAGMLFNGQGRPIDLDSTANTLPASMGGNRTPIIDQEDLRTGAVSWVATYHAHLQDGNAPISEVPPRLRRITVAEAACLQSFPITFQFFGSQTSQYRQIGNAVPPKMAYAVAQALMSALNGV